MGLDHELQGFDAPAEFANECVRCIFDQDYRRRVVTKQRAVFDSALSYDAYLGRVRDIIVKIGGRLPPNEPHCSTAYRCVDEQDVSPPGGEREMPSVVWDDAVRAFNRQVRMICRGEPAEIDDAGLILESMQSAEYDWKFKQLWKGFQRRAIPGFIDHSVRLPSDEIRGRRFEEICLDVLSRAGLLPSDVHWPQQPKGGD